MCLAMKLSYKTKRKGLASTEVQFLAMITRMVTTSFCIDARIVSYWSTTHEL